MATGPASARTVVPPGSIDELIDQETTGDALAHMSSLVSIRVTVNESVDPSGTSSGRQDAPTLVSVKVTTGLVTTAPCLCSCTGQGSQSGLLDLLGLVRGTAAGIFRVARAATTMAAASANNLLETQSTESSLTQGLATARSRSLGVVVVSVVSFGASSLSCAPGVIPIVVG